MLYTTAVAMDASKIRDAKSHLTQLAHASFALVLFIASPVTVIAASFFHVVLTPATYKDRVFSVAGLRAMRCA